MSKDGSRPTRARTLAFCRFDGLEDRVLMSVAMSAVQESANQSVSISAPTYASQQVSSVEVTLTRAATAGPYSLTDIPLTVDFSASLGSTAPDGHPATLPVSASKTFTPVNESITFPVGVAVETVQIPINSGASNPGSVPIDLSATWTSDSLQFPSGQASGIVYLVTGPSALPSTPAGMIGAQLLVRGKTASGIAITFSKSMAPATVDNIHNYVVTQAPPKLGFNNFWQANTYASSLPVPLRSARYDPTTNTVTLIPKKPLRSSIVYTIQNATPIAKHTLTDSEGNAALGNFTSPAGVFYFKLEGAQPLTWTAPQTPTIYDGSQSRAAASG
jgi:hypothetical protein